MQLKLLLQERPLLLSWLLFWILLKLKLYLQVLGLLLLEKQGSAPCLLRFLLTYSQLLKLPLEFQSCLPDLMQLGLFARQRMLNRLRL